MGRIVFLALGLHLLIGDSWGSDPAISIVGNKISSLLLSLLGTGGLGSCAGKDECREQGLIPSCPCPPAPQVYSATNVELVTRTRTEHLSDQDKSRSKGKPRCACPLPSHTLVWGQGQECPGTSQPILTCSLSHPAGTLRWREGGAVQVAQSPLMGCPLLLRGEDSVPVLPGDGPAALLPQRGEQGRGARGLPEPGWAGRVSSFCGLRSGPGAHPGSCAAGSQPHQPYSHFPR